MISVKDEGIVLEKTAHKFESQAVLNPACVVKDGITHLFYRAVRSGNFSTIGHATLDGVKVLSRDTQPILVPEKSYELHGIEDPHITQLEGIYYLFYIAYDGQNARPAYATSSDLIHFEKKGLVFPSIPYEKAAAIFKKIPLSKKYAWYGEYVQESEGRDVKMWDKDVVLFPKKINGKFALLHRITPGIQIVYFESFDELTDSFWDNYLSHLNEYVVLDPSFWFESRKIGAGCVPLETPQGWLLIYHGVEGDGSKRIYHTSAALLDKDDPTKVIGRLREPLFSPTALWEKVGDVNDVVFPTGLVLREDVLLIYHGAADRCIAAKSMSLSELLDELLRNPVSSNYAS